MSQRILYEVLSRSNKWNHTTNTILRSVFNDVIRKSNCCILMTTCCLLLIHPLGTISFGYISNSIINTFTNQGTGIITTILTYHIIVSISNVGITSISMELVMDLRIWIVFLIGIISLALLSMSVSLYLGVISHNNIGTCNRTRNINNSWNGYSLTSVSWKGSISLTNHIILYCCPNNLTFIFGIGFILYHYTSLQIVTGILLALHYTWDINHSYFSVRHIIQDVYYGWCLWYSHSNSVSFILGAMYLHIGRGLYINSNVFNMTLWTSGVIIFIFMVVIAFLGYVLTWGQISFWGSTVIWGFLWTVPCLLDWFCGSFYVSNPTLKRFFIFHLLISLIGIGFSIIHLFLLHYLGSNNPLAYNHNNTITIFPTIIIKDLLLMYILGIGFMLQLSLGIFNLAHPDNSIEVYELLTPQHIVPEWYFLHYYVILKTVPSKWLGFIILLLGLYILLIWSELNKLMTNCIRLTLVSFMWINNSNLIITYSFLIFLIELWIGALIPQDLVISSGRVLNFINNYNLWIHLYSWTH